MKWAGYEALQAFFKVVSHMLVENADKKRSSDVAVLKVRGKISLKKRTLIISPTVMFAIYKGKYWRVKSGIKLISSSFFHFFEIKK